jgi:hypothetical protein
LCVIRGLRKNNALGGLSDVAPIPGCSPPDVPCRKLTA